MKQIDSALQGKEWLVGSSITTADVNLWMRVKYLYQLVLDAKFRESVPNATAWFNRINKLPEVIKVVGHIKACQVPLLPQGVSCTGGLELLAWTKGHFFSNVVLTTATFAGVDINFRVPDQAETNSKEFKDAKANWSFPLLRTEEGEQIAESAAIAAYVARIGNKPSLLGGSAWEQA